MAGTDNYMYVVSVDTKYPIQDSFYLQNKLFDKYAPMINTMLVVALVSIAGVFYWICMAHHHCRAQWKR